MTLSFAPLSPKSSATGGRWRRWFERRRQREAISYDAFISYSHAKDKPVASALQAVVQKLGKPWYRRRALRIFRDDTSLSAAPELWPAIEQALARSRHLIFLASPEAAASMWVDKEIDYWRTHKGLDTLLIAVTDGTLVWEEVKQGFSSTQQPLLPPAMAGYLGSEPKWVDLSAYRDAPDPNDSRFIELGADFAAAIHGIPKEDLLSEELRQQRRALSLAWSAAGCLVVLVLAALWGWMSAVEQKHEAQAQRDRAETALEQADRNYKNALRGGASVVEIVRGMVDAGTLATQSAEKLLAVSRKTVDQLENERESDDLLEVEWQLLDALSVAYLDVPGEGSLETAKKTAVLASRLHLHNLDSQPYALHLVESEIRLGNAYEVRGDLDEALFHFNAARDQMVRLIESDRENGDRQRSLGYIHGRIGDVLRKTGKLQEAQQRYQEYLRLTSELARRDNPKPDWIRGLALAQEKIGDILRDLDQPGPALDAYADYQKTALKLVAMEPPNAPNLTWRLDLWISYQRIGDILLDQGENERAMDNFERFHKGAEEAAVLDPDQGQWQRFLANSDIKLGDGFIAEGRFREALERQDEALKIYALLTSKDKTRATWQRNLALVHQRRGVTLLAMKNIPAAAAEFKACIDLEAIDAAIDSQLVAPRHLNQECMTSAGHLAQTTPK
jgi:tetratricopeptide (TPR) repeat protein